LKRLELTKLRLLRKLSILDRSRTLVAVILNPKDFNLIIIPLVIQIEDFQLLEVHY